MKRYAAFLRGVSPMNAKMSDLRLCLERCGFANVQTVLASGNVVFDARAANADVLAKKVERAMREDLGHTFLTIVRSVDELLALIDDDPFASFRLAPNAKRIVTFLRDAPEGKVKLPPERDGARILAVRGGEAFAAYVPNPRAPMFMTLIEKTFGKAVTTRTWETVKKVAHR